MVEEQKLRELWKNLTESLGSARIDTPEEAKTVYAELLRFLSLAWSMKLQTVSQIKLYEAGLDKAKFMGEIREGIMKNLHYEERRLYRELSLPEQIRQAKIRLKTIDDMLEASRQFERILRSLYETMKLDLKLGFEGHS